MKLYLKRDVSPDCINFLLFDERGQEKYVVKNEKTKLSSKLVFTVRDRQGNIAAKIRRFPVAGACAFVLRVGKSHINLVMVPTKRGVYSVFYGNNWHILGDIAAKDFTIIDVDKTVILNHRRHADHCTLEVFRPRKRAVLRLGGGLRQFYKYGRKARGAGGGLGYIINNV